MLLNLFQELNMMSTILCLVALAAVCIAQPEYTTPGGILNTNCMKGCTEIAVHESNCYPPCDNSRYERCVLVPRHPEPSCPFHKDSSALMESKRAYACRCYPCLYRSSDGTCVPSCPTEKGET